MPREFLDLTPVDDAIEAFRRHFPPGAAASGAAESVALESCVGRVLAADVVAASDLPAWPKATVDGYAVQARSVRGAAGTRPAYLKVVGEVAMGRPPAGPVGPGEAVRIPTGGMLPEGADAVVMVEHTDMLDEATVEVVRAAAEGDGVNRAGEDFEAGQRLLAAGTRLAPQDVAVLAAAGVARPPCRRPLSVAILSTGDELVPADREPGRAQVRDINGPAVAALVAAAGHVAVPLGIVADERDALAAALERAVAAHDAVMISGGSSVGRADFTYDVIQALSPGAPGGRGGAFGAAPGEPGVFVHGVAIRPGKPTILARVRGGKPVFGLPGHPASSIVVFLAIVQPCLAHLAGEVVSRRPRTVPARMARPVRSAQGKDDYVKVRLVPDGASGFRAEPVFGQSGNVLPLSAADGLVRIPFSSEGVAEGDAVDVLVLP
jgi:molybdopterin molybdotransferase